MRPLQIGGWKLGKEWRNRRWVRVRRQTTRGVWEGNRGASHMSNEWYVPVACTRLDFQYSTGISLSCLQSARCIPTGNLATADAVFSGLGLWLWYLAVLETKLECIGTLSGGHNLQGYEDDVFVGGILETFAYTLHDATKYCSKSHIIARLCLRLSCTNFDQILQNNLKFWLLWISCVQFKYNYLSIPEDIHN